MATKLLLDTDIGSDIDDAVAIAYLLGREDCDLLGITTVTGDTAKRAALADLLCLRAGRADVQVVAGLRDPLGEGPGQPLVPQFDAVATQVRSMDFGNANGNVAIEFLADRIRSSPGQVTLLAIGPLTNVATLFQRHPDTAAALGRLVLMCGSFGVGSSTNLPEREWNALCDPLSTELVFGTAVPGGLLSVGLDVTLCCKMPAEECRRDFNALGPLYRTVAEMAEVWFESASQITFHDPLAAAMIFDPSLCKTVRGKVSVVADGIEKAGQTLWRAEPEGPHAVCAQVDSQRFFEHFFHTANRRTTHSPGRG